MPTVVPFNEFVLKVHGRCNLACDYCYLYTSGDDSWRERPRVMSDEVVARASHRIAEHARRFSLGRVHVVLHGGEPLLAGPAVIGRIAESVSSALPPSTTLSLGVQTNGTLLNARFLEVFSRWGIKVGVSLDGTDIDHDDHRRHHHGGGSMAQIADGLALLSRPAHRHLFSGLLCTVDVTHDPVNTFQALVRHRPPVVDFLLPHGNWTRRPPQRKADARETPYADWLLSIFDYWFDAPERPTGIRLFENIMGLLLGDDVATESLGQAPCRTLVIETDGSLEQVDSLKSTYPGAARLGLNVNDHPLDTALSHPAIIASQSGPAALATECRACPVARICGGGLLAHRYRAGHGFENPSVYGPDLWKVIHHIRTRMLDALGEPL
ncbi:FxsB family radical SAM/SPASM domain protein [Streptomyces chartreusis]|uniref:FxsB family radical SAM/SPASM domain protein n=1 Tax=Streptomyces chartreusis TaxID=1969 RepID=A0A7H8TP77_STRCX|nr:FxsB family radical SAM/SPASM domain protein [Streptomyces chartreusis]